MLLAHFPAATRLRPGDARAVPHRMAGAEQVGNLQGTWPEQAG